LSDGGREATSPGQYRGDVRFRAPSALAIATLAGSLFLSACNDVNPPALTVNGTEISRVDFLDRLEYFQSKGDLFAEAPIFQQAPVNTSITDGIGADFARSLLSLEAQLAFIVAKAKGDGLDIENGDWTAEDSRVSRIFGDAAAELRPDVQEHYRSLYRALTAIGKNESKDLPSMQFEVLCLSHILVDDLVTATDLKGQLDQGADFAALARDNSTDPGSAANGGSLDSPDGSCYSPEAVAGGFIPEFAEAALAAAVDEVTVPVRTQYGYHLIKVTKRGIVGADDPSARSAVEARQNQAFSKWFEVEWPAAQVEVDPRFGVWDGPTQSVVPNPPTLANQEDLVDLDGLTVTDGSNG
jgi:hypothetical protein